MKKILKILFVCSFVSFVPIQAQATEARIPTYELPAIVDCVGDTLEWVTFSTYGEFTTYSASRGGKYDDTYYCYHTSDGAIYGQHNRVQLYYEHGGGIVK